MPGHVAEIIIQKHKVGKMRKSRLYADRPVRGGMRFKTLLLQAIRKHAGKFGIILNDKYLHGSQKMTAGLFAPSLQEKYTCTLYIIQNTGLFKKDLWTSPASGIGPMRDKP